MKLFKLCAIALFTLQTIVFQAELLAQGPNLHAPTMPGVNQSAVSPGTVEVVPINEIAMVEDMSASILERREQQLSQGWVDVTERQANILDTYLDSDSARSLSRNLGDVEASLHTEAADISGTFLEDAFFLGARPAGGFIDGSWTGLVRVFDSPTFGIIMLEEYDYVRAGSHIVLPREVVDSYVNGYPVLHSVLKATDDAVHTDIVWFTERKNFRLKMNSEVSTRSRLFQQVERALELLK